MSEVNVGNWKKSSLQVFWGEIAPRNHILQIYENDKSFLDSLEGFIGSGILAGDSVIIIATAQHRAAIEKRLRKQHGFNMDILASTNQYIALDAEETLARFMINGWPNEILFFEVINSLLTLAEQKGRKVRAFGEMVALLWQLGLNGATVQLENLWNQLHDRKDFTLYCAYPKIGFTQDMHASMENICCQHSKIIDGSPRPSTEIYYKTAV